MARRLPRRSTSVDILDTLADLAAYKAEQSPVTMDELDALISNRTTAAIRRSVHRLIDYGLVEVTQYTEVEVDVAAHKSHSGLDNTRVAVDVPEHKSRYIVASYGLTEAAKQTQGAWRIPVPPELRPAVDRRSVPKQPV